MRDGDILGAETSRTFDPRPDQSATPMHAQTVARLAELARQLSEVRGELSAMLGLTPLASSRLCKELAIAQLVTHVETLEIRLATLSVGLRYARPCGSASLAIAPPPRR